RSPSAPPDGRRRPPLVTALLRPCSPVSRRDLRPLPSFPTRRSSDLVDALDVFAGTLGHQLGDERRDDLEVLAVRLAVTHTELDRSEEHTSELQSRENLVCRLLLDKKNLSTLDPHSHLL